MKLKRLPIISLLICLTSCVETTETRTDLTEMSLTGSISKVEISHFYIKDKSPSQNFLPFIETVFFNAFGFITKIDWKGGEMIFEYADSAMGIKKKVTSYEDRQILNLAEFEDGLQTKYTSYDTNGLVNFQILTKFTEENTQSQSNRFDQNNQLTYKEIEKYNENGYKIRSESYSAEQLIECTEYTYDLNGKLSAIYIMDTKADTILHSQEIIYDIHGQEINRRVMNSEGELLFEKTQSTEYFYDQHNNWIKQIHTFSSGEVEIVKRKITYNK